MSFINIKNLSKRINRNCILSNINVSFNINEFICIVGKSGCGKTSLLNISSLLDNSYNGQISVNGRKINKFNRNRYRKSYFTFIFQDYGLINYLSLRENCESFINKNNKEQYEKLLNEFEIKDKENSKTNETSGGEKQRYALVKASLKNSKVVIADEPTGSLDNENSEKIMNFLKKNNEGKLILMATHNIELARKYATRIIYIDEGKIINDEKLSECKEIEKGEPCINIENNKWKNIFRSSIRFLKLNGKGLVPLIILMSLCLSFIIQIFGAKSGFSNYINNIPKTIPDARYFEITENENTTSFEETMENYNVEYIFLFNYSFIFNNFLKGEITKANSINFDYQISVIDFKMVPNFDNNELISINEQFNNLYKKDSIIFNIETKIIDTSILCNKNELINCISKETALYNLPKLYINFSRINEIISEETRRSLESQTLIYIPKTIFCLSPLNGFYNSLKNEKSISFKSDINQVKNSIVIDSTSYIYFGPLNDLINSISYLMIILIVLLILIIYSSFTILLQSFYKKRLRELSINYAFGESEKELQFRLLIQNSIIVFISLTLSILISLIISFSFNPLINKYLNISNKIKVIEVEIKGLIAAFFCSMVILLASSNKKILNKDILEELKNE